MFKYIRDKLFFLIDKDEKEYIRQKVMNRDHKVVRVILSVIALFELIVLIMDLVASEPSSNPGLDIASRVLYICLICVCLMCIIALEILKRKNKTFPYFVFVSIFTFFIMLWGVGMSIIISFDSFSLLYYVLTIIAASALICLEPWIETLCAVLSTVIYVVLYYTLPGVQRTDDLVFISGVLLALAISLACFFFNFYRRINAISLEYQVVKLNALLDEKAKTDQLTGLNNRLFLSDRLERNEDEVFADGGAMMLDLDHFKILNDTYGHLAGDKCLTEIGRIIKEAVQEKNGFSVRYGGEEFLIYLEKTNKEELVALAENIKNTVESNKIEINGNQKISYTVSIGLSLGKNKESFEEMIGEADNALYKAKETRNAIHFID